jgi:hypothetical protein
MASTGVYFWLLCKLPFIDILYNRPVHSIKSPQKPCRVYMESTWNCCGLRSTDPDPDFYAKAKKPGQPRVITPHAERRALQLITPGAACDATDVQWKLFQDISSPTVWRMFSKKGLHGQVRWAKPWLSKQHIKSCFVWACTWIQRREFFW